MEKIKWGLLGTAKIATQETIPGMLLADNCEMTAVAGRSLEKALAFQKEYGFKKAYGSYDELLADPEIQAVYIPLPNSLHAEWAIKAMQAKKHVLSEKPMAPNEEEAKRMIQASQDNGVHLMEAFAYLHSPLIASLKDDLDSGIIGELHYVETEFTTPTHSPSNIRMHKETYGGSFYDLGCYCVSLILWMFGEEPESVFASAEFSDTGVDTIATGVLKFSGERRAIFNCGMTLAPGGGRIDRMSFYGTKGKIICDAAFNSCGTLHYSISNEDGTTDKYIEARHNYALEIEQLGRCITNGETPHVSNEFTLRNARTMDRILQKMGY